MAPMIFEGEAYLGTLAHLGEVRAVPPLAHPVLARPIPRSPHHDALGPWPYAGAPEAARLRTAFEMLREQGLVSYTGVIRPGAAFDSRGAADAGFAAVPLKEHFIIDGAVPPLSRKARRNLAIAQRHWRIDAAPAAAEAAAEGARLHLQLRRRRTVSTLATMPAAHFRNLVAVPGIATVAVRDDAGIGGLVMAARDRGETHLLHMLVDDRGLRTCASYLLMQAVIDLWARDGAVYLGGTPAGADGPGVARFKGRYASRRAPVLLLTAVLRPRPYGMLAATRGAGPGFFPSYREPYERLPPIAEATPREAADA